jgi:plastocyanin
MGMAGTIDVLPLSESLPKTDAEYGSIASREIAKDLETAAEIAAEANQNDEDGGPTVSVGAGNKRVTNLRFFPSTLNIRVGQTVTFLKTHDPTEPHTVTFGAEVGPPPAELFPAGPTSTGSPSTQVHSGWLQTQKQVDFYNFASGGPPWSAVVARTKYKVTFTAPGVYDYICAIHDDAGMRATVIVH